MIRSIPSPPVTRGRPRDETIRATRLAQGPVRCPTRDPAHPGFSDAVRREEARQSLPPDLREEFQRLSTWVHSLWMRYGRRIRVNVVDAASLEGVWKSFRYRVRKYPAIVVDRQEVHVGSDFDVVEPMIERHVAERTS